MSLRRGVLVRGKITSSDVNLFTNEDVIPRTIIVASASGVAKMDKNGVK